jgi:hypothetical protein
MQPCPAAHATAESSMHAAVLLAELLQISWCHRTGLLVCAVDKGPLVMTLPFACVWLQPQPIVSIGKRCWQHQYSAQQSMAIVLQQERPLLCYDHENMYLEMMQLAC